MHLKKISKIILIIIALLILIFALSPTYLQKSLLHWYANLDDFKISYNDTVKNDIPEEWKLSQAYNSFSLSANDIQYLENQRSVAFLVIQDKKIVFEKYWEGYGTNSYSNIFSATKSIVSLLIGVAIDEGFIQSVNEPIGRYIQEFSTDKRGEITIKNLLTMSSGLDWDEAYSTPFSITTKAYYGEKLRKVTTSQKITMPAGKMHNYQSGNTQLLSFILEQATQKSINDYAAEKLWKPIKAVHPALWSLDKENGDERGFCCIYTNARDLARIGQLILNNGRWNDKQIISESYLNEMLQPANYLIDKKSKKPCNFYGYQWWILSYGKYSIPYMRGHRGQYVYAIPEKNAVIVRFGKRKDKLEKGPITLDIEKYVEIGLNILENNP